MVNNFLAFAGMTAGQRAIASAERGTIPGRGSKAAATRSRFPM
jgi:hypothetical protein